MLGLILSGYLLVRWLSWPSPPRALVVHSPMDVELLDRLNPGFAAYWERYRDLWVVEHELALDSLTVLDPRDGAVIFTLAPELPEPAEPMIATLKFFGDCLNEVRWRGDWAPSECEARLAPWVADLVQQLLDSACELSGVGPHRAEAALQALTTTCRDGSSFTDATFTCIDSPHPTTVSVEHGSREDAEGRFRAVAEVLVRFTPKNVDFTEGCAEGPYDGSEPPPPHLRPGHRWLTPEPFLRRCRDAPCFPTAVPPGGRWPRAVPRHAPIADATRIVAHGPETCAILSGGELVCWGDDVAIHGGYVGAIVGRRGRAIRKVATVVDDLPPVEDVMLAEMRRCVRLGDGEVRCIGRSLIGGEEVVHGTWVSAPELRGAEQIVLGHGAGVNDGGCARFSDGAVRCWGVRLAPARLAEGGSQLLDDAAEIAVDLLQTALLARRRDGTVVRVAWPGGGPEAPPGSAAPVAQELPAMAGATALISGHPALGALMPGGRPLAVGENFGGVLGADIAEVTTEPVPVHGLTGATQVVFGLNHSCAVFDDGTLRCWGKNDEGQLGDGTTVGRDRPVAVVGLDDAVEVTLGGGHTCARHRDGRVSCWGDNSSGALGDGTTISRTRPTPVLQKATTPSR